ncbi:hypothetical protein MMC13_002159 [Lambiella insularis]|nr:hypothetical protein [Lambiella insularis]
MNSELDAESIEHEAFGCFAKTIWLFQSARTAFSRQPILRAEIIALELRTSCLRENMEELKYGTLHAACARSYALVVATQVQINALLDALRGGHDAALKRENARLCADICALVGQVHRHRPLGTVYVPFVLRVAYMGADSDEARACVCELLLDFFHDFQGDQALVRGGELKWLARYLSLSDLTGG